MEFIKYKVFVLLLCQYNKYIGLDTCKVQILLRRSLNIFNTFEFMFSIKLFSVFNKNLKLLLLLFLMTSMLGIIIMPLLFHYCLQCWQDNVEIRIPLTGTATIALIEALKFLSLSTFIDFHWFILFSVISSSFSRVLKIRDDANYKLWIVLILRTEKAFYNSMHQL